MFLAGWSLRLMAEGRGEQRPIRDVMLRLFGRALELYAAQVLITMLAIAMLALSATELDNPLLLQWHNAAAVFYDPVPTHIGLAVLTHQLGYFDILPLYVVLMLMAPFFALHRPHAAGAAVAAVARALPLRARLPPDAADLAGRRHLVLQSARLADRVRARLRLRRRPDRGVGAFARRHIVWLRVVGAADRDRRRCSCTSSTGGPTRPRCPTRNCSSSPTRPSTTPMRLIQFLALVAVFSFAWPYIRTAAEPPVCGRPVDGLIGLFAMLGRNSLYVFCVGSLFSLSAQVVRLYYRGSVGSDTAVVLLGILIMAFTAWLAELRQRGRPAPASPAPRSSAR